MGSSLAFCSCCLALRAVFVSFCMQSLCLCVDRAVKIDFGESWKAEQRHTAGSRSSGHWRGLKLGQVSIYTVEMHGMNLPSSLQPATLQQSAKKSPAGIGLKGCGSSGNPWNKAGGFLETDRSPSLLLGHASGLLILGKTTNNGQEAPRTLLALQV